MIKINNKTTNQSKMTSTMTQEMYDINTNYISDDVKVSKLKLKFMPLKSKIKKQIEYESFGDFRKLMNNNRTIIHHVYAYLKQCLVEITNNGNRMLLTKGESLISKYTGLCDTQWIAKKETNVLRTLKKRVIVFDENGQTSKIYINNVLTLMIENGIIRSYDGLDFIPYLHKKPNTGKRFNTFVPFTMLSYTPTKRYDYANSALNMHIKKYLCAGDEKVFQYVSNYIARTIQIPDEIGEIALLFVSKQGIGKDMFATLIQEMLGSTKIHRYGNSAALFEKFNVSSQGDLIAFCNELSSHGATFNLNDQLKDILTKKTTDIEPKGLEKYTIRHCCSYVFFSNNHYGIRIEESDRRYCAIECDSSIANNRKYFTNLWAWLKNTDFIKSAFDYYSTLDISEFDQRDFPNTELRSRMKRNQLNTSKRFIIELTHDETLFEEIAAECKHKDTELYHRYKLWCEENNEKKKTKKIFKDDLRDFGIEHTRHRIELVKDNKKVNVRYIKGLNREHLIILFKEQQYYKLGSVPNTK